MTSNTALRFRDADPAERFERLAAEWEAATRFTSSVAQMAVHPAYQQIIGLGPGAVPLILARLGERGGHWFWALRAITGENPVPAEHAGDVRAMTADWLAWGRETGLLTQA